jgi:hypothetical protein
MGRGTARNMWSFLTKIKFGKSSASVGFIKKKFVTMHGHLNVKLFLRYRSQCNSGTNQKLPVGVNIVIELKNVATTCHNAGTLLS